MSSGRKRDARQAAFACHLILTGSPRTRRTFHSLFVNRQAGRVLCLAKRKEEMSATSNATDTTVTQNIFSRQSLNQNIATWDEIAVEHGSFVRAVVVNAGARGSDVDDVVQTVLFKVGAQLGSFDPSKGSLRAWLGTIARHCTIDLHRTRERVDARFVPIPDTANEPDIEVVETDNSFDRLFDREAAAFKLNALIARVRAIAPPRSFGIFAAHVLDEQSVADVATAFGVSITAVYVALTRTRKLFRSAARELDREEHERLATFSAARA